MPAWLINLVRFLRGEETERLPVAGNFSEGTRIDANSDFAAEVVRNSGEVTTIRWRVTGWHFLIFGWAVVFVFVISAALAVVGLLRLSLELTAGGVASCAMSLFMSRCMVLLGRPRRHTMLRLLGRN